MVQRPYFKYSGEQLREEFAANLDNRDVLKAIRAELTHRSTAKMRALLVEVEKHLSAPASGADNEGMPGKRGSGVATPVDQPDGRSDLPPDDRRRPDKFTLVQHPGVAGRPPKYDPPLARNRVLDVPANASRARRFSAAIGALVDEMKTNGAGTRSFILSDGIAVELAFEGFGYVFEFVEEAEIFEEASVEVLVGQQRSSGCVVSLLPGKIVLCLEVDLGPRVRSCVLRIDNTALLVALKDRFDEVEAKKLETNTALADAVLSKEDHGSVSVAIERKQLDETLSQRQNEAIERALTRSVFYIWGPPGTGKTQTLAALVGELFAADKRVLVCSNTNKAVDQLLARFCEHLGQGHPGLVSGLVLRIGRASREELHDYEDYLIPQRIVERLSRGLQERKAELQASLDEVEASLVLLDRVLRQFGERDRASQRAQERKADLEAQRNSRERVRGELRAAERGQASDRRALEAWSQAGQLRRVLMPSEASLKAQLDRSTARVRVLTSSLSGAGVALERATADVEALVARVSMLDAELAAHDHNRILAERNAIEGKRCPLLDELKEIQAQLDNMQRQLVARSKVIGTTVTKAYLSARDFGPFDAVVVDEASMVLLPALYFASALARERVIISGDFNQLPPIVQSNQEAIVNEIVKDAFEESGIKAACRNQIGDSRCTMLDVQHRMVETICALIRDSMKYSGLKTDREVSGRSRGAKPPAPFDGPLTVIDSSRLWPFESRNVLSSRFNLMHTLLSRNLCWHLRNVGFVDDQAALGVCTPYAAQAKLMSEILKDEGLGELVTASTVHRFQGAQKRMMLIDIPESIGSGFNIGRFIQADHMDDAGAKLQNVAISRTQDHLVVLANLTYLDAKLPSYAMLRSHLYEMQRHGVVVDAQEVLTLRPIADDLKEYGSKIDVDWGGDDVCVFRQEGFDLLFQRDVANARRSVAVFSGFLTPQRVGVYGELFRRKVAEQVSVRCVTRPPWRNGTIDPQDTTRALNALEAIGVVVDTRAVIHEKVVIVDDEIVWFGSLNPLSHTSRTDELMQRVVSKGYAAKLAGLLAIAPSGGVNAEGLAARGENPRCRECGARTCYLRGRWGPYFKCEGCGRNQGQFSRSR